MTKKGNQEGREILVSCMKELGFRVWPSHTNFIYFDPGVDVKWFADRLLDYGIIIRGNFKANRISIGTPEEDRFVCKAMREIMANPLTYAILPFSLHTLPEGGPAPLRHASTCGEGRQP